MPKKSYTGIDIEDEEFGTAQCCMMVWCYVCSTPKLGMVHAFLKMRPYGELDDWSQSEFNWWSNDADEVLVIHGSPLISITL